MKNERKIETKENWNEGKKNHLANILNLYIAIADTFNPHKNTNTNG